MNTSKLGELFDNVGFAVIGVMSSSELYINKKAEQIFSKLEITRIAGQSAIEALLGEELYAALESLEHPGISLTARKIFEIYYDIDTTMIDDVFLIYIREHLPTRGEFCPVGYEILLSIGRIIRSPTNLLFSSMGRIPEASIPEEYEKFYSIMRKQCYNLLRLSNNLMDLKYFDKNQVNTNMVYSNFTLFIEDIAQKIIPYIEEYSFEHDIRVNFNFETHGGHIKTLFDKQKIERMILNLISFAMKRVIKGGKILLKLEKSPESAIISIKHDGLLTDASKYSYAFSDFASDDSDIGFSTGMAIVKFIARLHGGSVFVEDFEEGSKAVVTIPIKDIPNNIVKSSLEQPDYAGWFSHYLLELSDVLPSRCYLSNMGW